MYNYKYISAFKDALVGKSIFFETIIVSEMIEKVSFIIWNIETCSKDLQGWEKCVIQNTSANILLNSLNCIKSNCSGWEELTAFLFCSGLCAWKIRKVLHLLFARLKEKILLLYGLGHFFSLCFDKHVCPLNFPMDTPPRAAECRHMLPVMLDS